MRKFLVICLLLCAGAADAQRARVSKEPFQWYHPGYVVGRWYRPLDVSAGSLENLNAGTTVINNITCEPGGIAGPNGVTIDQLDVDVTGAGTGNLQLAIYNNNPGTSRPGTEITHTSNIVMTSTLAVIATLGSAFHLAPGYYWWCVNADTPSGSVNSSSWKAAFFTHRQPLVANIGSAAGGDILGWNNSQLTAIHVAKTFGTWGDLTGTAFTITTGANNRPFTIGFHVSSIP